MRIYFVRGGTLFPPFFKVQINLAKKCNADKLNKQRPYCSESDYDSYGRSPDFQAALFLEQQSNGCGTLINKR
jgi:hypothetical protein